MSKVLLICCLCLVFSSCSQRYGNDCELVGMPVLIGNSMGVIFQCLKDHDHSEDL